MENVHHVEGTVMTLDSDLMQNATEPAQRPNGAQQHGPTDRRRSARAAFSPRQTEIVELIALGLSDKEIAQKLHLTEGTIGWYLKKIFLKWRVHSRVALAARFLQETSLKCMPSDLPPHEREGSSNRMLVK
ncbi:MAG: LuxR C-terminal-related transcriptional regulator [Anaerolineaceae bacterium]|jgi:DNA-binding NarL/FixJ family response regulator|nr:LuxR C-terminal-related transcriptional regulator [Anaerolineaceae bacterium]